MEDLQNVEILGVGMLGGLYHCANFATVAETW